MSFRDPDRIEKFGLHVIFPALMPAAFFAVAFTPVQVIGCRNRGLLALTIAFMSGFAALAAMIRSRRESGRGPAAQVWWIISALIMTVPVVALLIMA